MKPTTDTPFEADIGNALENSLRTHHAAGNIVAGSEFERTATKNKRTPPAKRVKRAEKIKKVLKDVEERKEVLRDAYEKAGGFNGLVDRAVLVSNQPMTVEEYNATREYTGLSVSYYQLPINHPTTPGREPYTCECNDIIEALGMSYAEGNVFKALWRKCAARQGKSKRGYTDGKYDAEKMVFFSQRVLDDEITPKGNKA